MLNYLKGNLKIGRFFYKYNFFTPERLPFQKSDIKKKQNLNFMKKVFSLIAVIVAATFVACGPSAEEQAKLKAEKKRIEDSIASAMSAAENAAQTTDSASATTAKDSTGAK